MKDGARKLTREVQGARRPPGTPRSWVEQAVVKTVTAAGAADGNALVTVTWRGQDVFASYLSSYTPVAGHVVAVVIQPPSLPLILSRVIGTPA